jgi:hypothetical protein
MEDFLGEGLAESFNNFPDPPKSVKQLAANSIRFFQFSHQSLQIEATDCENLEISASHVAPNGTLVYNQSEKMKGDCDARAA